MKRSQSENLSLKKLKASSSEVRELNDKGPHINSLPEDIFLKIFRFLKHNDLSRISRVCKKWNTYTRRSILWKKVDVMFRTHYRQKFQATKLIIRKIPSFLTHIRLDFRSCYNWTEPLYFKKFSERLGKCPHLQTLILYHAQLSCSLPSVIDLCTHFLQNVQTLVLRYSSFNCCSEEISYVGGYDDISKIEVLDLVGCELKYIPPFSRMPYLKELYLAHSIAAYFWIVYDPDFLSQLEVLDIGHTEMDLDAFPTIQYYGNNLKELYLTSLTFLRNEHFYFDHETFPRLETICLKNIIGMKCDDIISLIYSCQSLRNIYVNKIEVEKFAEHPHVVANKDFFKNVKLTDATVKKRDYFYD